MRLRAFAEREHVAVLLLKVHVAVCAQRSIARNLGLPPRLCVDGYEALPVKAEQNAVQSEYRRQSRGDNYFLLVRSAELPDVAVCQTVFTISAGNHIVLEEAFVLLGERTVATLCAIGREYLTARYERYLLSVRAEEVHALVWA